MLFFKKQDQTITVSTESIVKTILVAFAAYILFRVVGDISHQLTLIFVSMFLAIALNPAVTWLTVRLKSKSRTRATGVAYLFVMTVLVCLGLLIIPPLVSQTTEFIKEVPQTISNFKTQDSAAANFVRKYGLTDQLDKLSKDFSGRFGDVSGPFFSTATRVGGTIVSFVTVLILTFMMLVEGPLWYGRLMLLVPEKDRAHRHRIAKKMYKVVTGYVNGQVLIAGIAAVFAVVALMIFSTIFDAKVNVIALGGIIFLFGLIPLIGNIIGATLVALFCLFSSTSLAIAVSIYFLVYQQLENATLQPYIQSRSNQLTPLIVFLAALLGVGLGGIVGALAAIPIAGCLRIVLEDRYGHKFVTNKQIETKKT